MESASPPPARSPRRARRPWVVAAALIVASQAWPWSRLVPALPPFFATTRSPSSDVLLQALPIVDAADRLAAIDRRLPQTPGVVVAHGSAGALASAYMVIAMRLWPRPVSLVACEPVPHVEQFRVPHPVPAPTWRIDLVPGGSRPWTLSATATADPEALCRPGGAP